MGRSLRELFTASPQGYALWAPTEARNATGKVASSHIREVKGPVPDEAWEDHIKGENNALILSPTLPDKTVLFACIDIDPHSADKKGAHVAARAMELLASKDLPFAVTESKSGGAHCWVFFHEGEPAHEVRRVLDHIVGAIKLGQIFDAHIDIRPTVSSGKSAYIQMPYFGDGSKEPEISSRRMPRDGGYLTLAEFVAYCNDHCIIPLKDMKRIVTQQLGEMKRATTATERRYKSLEEAMPDLPPCYDPLMRPGVVFEGGRNEVLAHLSSKLMLALPDDWREILRDVGYSFSPPLPSNEIDTIASSMERSRAGVICNASQVAPFCNKEVCLKRKFGVGQMVLPTQNAKNTVLIKKMTKDLPSVEDGESADEYFVTFEIENWDGEVRMDQRCMVSPTYFSDMLTHRWPSLRVHFQTKSDFVTMLDTALSQPGVVYFEKPRPYETSPAGVLETVFKKHVSKRMTKDMDRPAADIFERGYCVYYPDTNDIEISVTSFMRDVEASIENNKTSVIKTKKSIIFDLLERSRVIEPHTMIEQGKSKNRHCRGMVWRMKPRLKTKTYEDDIPGWFEPHQASETAKPY